MVQKDLKVLLDVEDVPKQYYNINPDLPEPPAPPLNPATKEPIPPEALKTIFPNELVNLEISGERFVNIPEEVREMYIRVNRPSPLCRATRLEKYLKTPAKIFFKREDLNPCGSHKPNTAIAQSYYAMKEGITRLTTETGAGQWGSALAFANCMFGIKTTVYMVRVSYDQKPGRRTIMQMYGAEVFPSPSERTKFGRKLLKENPAHPGSLGVAISEALEDMMTAKDAKYSLGSVLTSVITHQTVIGLEAKKQFEMIDTKPDVLVGCVGGGSNFGGFSYPFIYENKKKKLNARFVAVEPKSVPSMTEGKYEYDFGDSAGMTPTLLMYTLGHNFIPSPIHAGGLRYHGCAPSLSNLIKNKVVEAVSYPQLDTFQAADMFAKTEGIIVAPETSHALKGAIVEALNCKKKGEEKVICFNLSGHGLLDLGGYDKFLSGQLK
ncbi:MAG: TrpB-like pyridoxal phosphate-dependent enzyme [Candidatus Micrarchaeota archaeon]|nr:TrpB-like pyridoxal phosphate-dependent enzyme [Candidatus Micrarchaeota archaeon]